MAPRKTLNAGNLESLGASRLAALLMELGEGNAVIKRRLRLELAGAQSPAELVNEIRKRLATIARSRGFVDWHNRKALIDDLETQRKAIVDQVAKQMPAEGLDLMWRFLELASPVFQRADDSSGTISDVFRTATANLGDIASSARPDPKQLADQVFGHVTRNQYGELDDLIQALRPALGPAGLEHLKQRVIAWSTEQVSKPAAKDRKILAWGSGGAIYADDVAKRSRDTASRWVLREIADAQGDADSFAAQYDAHARKVPSIAAAIAQRLLKARRAEEAWQVLEAIEQRRGGSPDFDWEDARIAVLEALGRGDDAQAARWSCFERSLSAPHLRYYLKKLADFDDFEAEQRALDHAERYPSLLDAVAFLVAWPALDRAAKIVQQRVAELDGNRYDILTSAAEALAGRYPLAATLLLRAMIDFSLTHSRASRYGHAARHLRECAALASAIADFGNFETHDAYVARLRREHGKKTAFWNLMA